MLRQSGRVLIAVLSVFLWTCVPVAAQMTHPVTNLGDGGMGSGSLRNAILALTATNDIIRFNVPGGGTVTLLSALPQITHNNLTIDGTNNGDSISINGGGSRQIFSFGSPVYFLTLNDLTLQNGSASQGGAINFTEMIGATTLTYGGDMQFINNTATGSG